MDMRHFSLKLFLWIFLLFVSHNILAQNLDNYPSKPVRIVVPFAPGATTDFLGRVIAQHFTQVWGKSVLVENKIGAAG